MKPISMTLGPLEDTKERMCDLGGPRCESSEPSRHEKELMSILSALLGDPESKDMYDGGMRKRDAKRSRKRAVKRSRRRKTRSIKGKR